jgi:hypothetical protein
MSIRSEIDEVSSHGTSIRPQVLSQALVKQRSATTSSDPIRNLAPSVREVRQMSEVRDSPLMCGKLASGKLLQDGLKTLEDLFLNIRQKRGENLGSNPLPNDVEAGLNIGLHLHILRGRIGNGDCHEYCVALNRLLRKFPAPSLEKSTQLGVDEANAKVIGGETGSW